MKVVFMFRVVVVIIKPKVTEFNHRGRERTEDERTENYDYPGNEKH